MSVEVKDTIDSEYCTKCGSKLENGENILVNRCIIKGSEDGTYIDKEHKWCSKCGKFILERKVGHTVSKSVNLMKKL